MIFVERRQETSPRELLPALNHRLKMHNFLFLRHMYQLSRLPITTEQYFSKQEDVSQP